MNVSAVSPIDVKPISRRVTLIPARVCPATEPDRCRVIPAGALSDRSRSGSLFDRIRPSRLSGRSRLSPPLMVAASACFSAQATR